LPSPKLFGALRNIDACGMRNLKATGRTVFSLSASSDRR